MMAGILIVVLHVIVCLVMYLLMRAGLLKIDRPLFCVIIFIPLWGELCALMMHFETVAGRDGRKTDLLENMRKGHEEKWEALTAEDENKEVASLEDVLLINDPSVRRSLILDLLMQDTLEYIPILNQARMNDDVEVVHYATTAMAELEKDFGLRLQKLEARYAEDPEDAEVLQEYTEFLEKYISSGLVRGQLLLIQKNQYLSLLQKRILLEENPDDYRKRMEGLLELGRAEEALYVLEKAEKKWPEKEMVWMMRLQYYFSQKQGEKIQELLNRMEKEKIYLSGENRETVEFWKRKGAG